MAMLTCEPRSPFNWNFRITGGKAGVAETSMFAMQERGQIRYGGEIYEVRKQGWLSGRWDLVKGGEVVATAHKPDALQRRFVIRAGEKLRFTAQAQSPFGRSYSLGSGGQVFGTIAPEHLFTRRTTIRCTPLLPELAQIFAFWLAALTWRRAAESPD
jgi:hypothetical protein